MMKKSLIYIDQENVKNSVDLLEVVRRIYGTDCETYGIIVNGTCDEAKGHFDILIQVSEEKVFLHDARSVTDLLQELQIAHDFDTIVIPATNFGRMLAPRLAMRLHVGLVADVTAIAVENNQLEMIRPAFSGKIMAGIIQQGKGPTMMSVRPNVFTYDRKAEKSTLVVQYHPTKLRESGIKLIETHEKEQTYDIRDSKVLISGGGGTIKSFDRLEELACALGGHVAASRKIIDKGIAPRSIQVGQSGRTVNPKLYIALGISGAIQHIEGLKHVETIISVNTNRNAPICSLSDLVVEGDAAEFIERLTNRINKANIDQIGGKV